MKIHTEQSLWRFEFWGGAEHNRQMLDYDEIEQIESILEDCYPEGIDEVTLNDIFRFDFETVVEWLGYRMDVDNWEIIREETEEETEDNEE